MAYGILFSMTYTGESFTVTSVVTFAVRPGADTHVLLFSIAGINSLYAYF